MLFFVFAHLFLSNFHFSGVVPEYQCAVKRKEKKAQKDKDKPNSTTNGSPETVKIEPELQRVILYTFYNCMDLISIMLIIVI